TRESFAPRSGEKVAEGRMRGQQPRSRSRSYPFALATQVPRDFLSLRPEPADQRQTAEHKSDGEPPRVKDHAPQSKARRQRQNERPDRMLGQLLAMIRLRVERLRDKDLADLE